MSEKGFYQTKENHKAPKHPIAQALVNGFAGIGDAYNAQINHMQHALNLQLGHELKLKEIAISHGNNLAAKTHETNEGIRLTEAQGKQQRMTAGSAATDTRIQTSLEHKNLMQKIDKIHELSGTTEPGTSWNAGDTGVTRQPAAPEMPAAENHEEEEH